MNFIQFITTRTFLKHFGLSLLITLVLVWICLSLLKRYTGHGEETIVPSYKGLTLEQIGQLESARNFDFLVIDSAYLTDQQPGTVVTQEPIPESRVKPGRTIYLTVASFVPEMVKMPGLIDLSVRQAKALLQTYGLEPGFVEIVPDLAKNAVLQVLYNGRPIRQGTLINKGSVIDLIIGSGSGTMAQVPFLIGMTRSQAQNELEKYGFILGNEQLDGFSDTTEARVYTQSPPYIYGKRTGNGTVFNLVYKSDKKFDFDEYIHTLVVDTIQSDSFNNE